MTGEKQDRQGRELKASDQNGVLLARPAEHKAKGQESHRQNRDRISMALVQVNTHLINSITRVSSAYGLASFLVEV